MEQVHGANAPEADEQGEYWPVVHGAKAPEADEPNKAEVLQELPTLMSASMSELSCEQKLRPFFFFFSLRAEYFLR